MKVKLSGFQIRFYAIVISEIYFDAIFYVRKNDFDLIVKWCKG